MRPAKRIICSLMLLLAAAATRAADFTPSARRAAISPFLAEVDDEFRRFAEEKRVPGLVWGIVLDAELVHTGNLGWAVAPVFFASLDKPREALALAVSTAPLRSYWSRFSLQIGSPPINPTKLAQKRTTMFVYYVNYDYNISIKLVIDTLAKCPTSS